MSTKDDGGCVFPVALMPGITTTALSLRDYFAAKAMYALIANAAFSSDAEMFAEQLIRNFHPDPVDYHSIICRSAYAMADAMLKERKA